MYKKGMGGVELIDHRTVAYNLPYFVRPYFSI